MGLFDSMKLKKKIQALETEYESLQDSTNGYYVNQVRKKINGNSSIDMPKDLGTYAEYLEKVIELHKIKTIGEYNENSEDFVYHYKVAGVSFDNEDGTSRQKNLKQLFKDYNNDMYNLFKEAEVTYNAYQYEGKDAYRIFINGLEVGNLPADIISDFKNDILYNEVTKCFPRIGKFKNDEGHFMYFCEMYQHYSIK